MSPKDDDEKSDEDKIEHMKSENSEEYVKQDKKYVKFAEEEITEGTKELTSHRTYEPSDF
jgi:hypothetical protein